MNAIRENDISDQVQERVQHAFNSGEKLRIDGAGTKSFYGNPVKASRLDVSGHIGIVEYEPSELVITVRCGTRLSDIEMVLADAGQMLAFEPPSFGENATLGGTIATGLSGPRRPYAGSVRDAMLGVRIINGKGEVMDFGGKVIKNVAGYDVSRLMTGSLGTLGVLLQVSLKVTPRPQKEMTISKTCPVQQAIGEMNRLAATPLPISGAAYADGRMHMRLSGSEAAVASAVNVLEHDECHDDNRFWQDLNEQRLAFFQQATTLWRISVSPVMELPGLAGEWLLDWGGAQRWYAGDEPAQHVREAAARAGGHATLFRLVNSREEGDSKDVFHPLPLPLATLNEKIKRAFDPAMILNPDKMYRSPD